MKKLESCWNCACLNMTGGRFVNDAECRHPKVVKVMQEHGLAVLLAKRLDEGCPFFTKDPDVWLKAKKPKPQETNQLSLL